MANVTKLSDGINTYDIKDNNAVHKTGNETIAGTKTFSSPIKAEIKAGYGGFEYASAYSPETIKYGRLASILINGAYQTNEIQFMVQQTNRPASLTFGEIKTRVHDTAGSIQTNDTEIAYTFMPKDMIDTGILEGLRLYYWNNFDTNQAKVEIWIRNPTWTTTTFSIIDTISTGSGRSTAWTFYKNDMYDNFPTDATGYKEARLSVLSIGTPTDTTATTGKQAATTGWVNTVGNNVVHRNGTEDIGGIKSFTNSYIQIKNNSISYTDTSKSQNGQNYINFWATDKQTGYINSYLRSATQTTTSIAAYFNDGTDSSVTELRLGANKNGTKWATVVTPTEDTNSSTQIDTVGARNTKLASYALDANVVHKTGAETVAGIKTFSDNINANTSVTIGQHSVMTYNSTTEALEFSFI